MPSGPWCNVKRFLNELQQAVSCVWHKRRDGRALCHTTATSFYPCCCTEMSEPSRKYSWFNPAVMEKSYTDSCKGGHHCRAPRGARDWQESLNSKHLHDVFSPYVTHQIEPDWLSRSRDRGSCGQDKKWKHDCWLPPCWCDTGSVGLMWAHRVARVKQFGSFKAFRVSFVDF